MCRPPPPQMVFFATLFGIILLENAGTALQIQCYQCEEMKQHDCSTPEYLVNCTVNVQDMCQKEVLVKEDGVHYRKSCASSGACLIASSGYQQFCTGKLNSVCITCCNTPLCNGPKKKRPVPNAATSLLLWSPRCSRTPPGPWGSFLLDLSSAGPLGPLLLPSLLVPMSVLFRV